MSDQVLKIEVERGFRDIEAVSFRGQISLEMNDHWCGDTETGFGATLSMSLSPEQAFVLGSFLVETSLQTQDKGEGVNE